MQVDDICNGIEKFEQFYGKELNDLEESIWIKSLSNMTKERFEEIIEYCFTEKTYMPKLATIFELDRTLQKVSNENKQKDEKVDCKYCLGIGFFELEYEDDLIKYSVGARCVCKNGDKYLMFKSIKDYGILRPGYFGNTITYKLKKYIFDITKKRLEEEKIKKK